MIIKDVGWEDWLYAAGLANQTGNEGRVDCRGIDRRDAFG